jgi:hypothetical protein
MHLRITFFWVLSIISTFVPIALNANPLPYTIVATGQTQCYDNNSPIDSPAPGSPFYGQDAQHIIHPAAYRDNGDGTITDMNTGLVWVQARGQKMSWKDAVAGAATCRVGNYGDWRMPTIKELYSLINFTGESMGPRQGSKPYLDTKYFQFIYGDPSLGERPIDCQDWSANEYVGRTMNNDLTVFGVNFADGRIKGYNMYDPFSGSPHLMYVRYVRGNLNYGKNNFVDNGDGTITDRATNLMWQKADSGTTFNWQGALAYAANLKLAGHADWRLPNAKELQSIVDYTRAPKITHSAAIDPIFQVTNIESYYWTSTTFLDGPPGQDYSTAVYVAFGRALGYMQMPPGSEMYYLIDVHGAGAQRSDPKAGDPAQYPYGRGPQGDDIRIYNYVRCVRDAGP